MSHIQRGHHEQVLKMPNGSIYPSKSIAVLKGACRARLFPIELKSAAGLEGIPERRQSGENKMIHDDLGIVQFDMDGNIIDHNENFLQIIGIGREKMSSG